LHKLIRPLDQEAAGLRLLLARSAALVEDFEMMIQSAVGLKAMSVFVQRQRLIAVDKTDERSTDDYTTNHSPS
jgi:hypothetical protein